MIGKEAGVPQKLRQIVDLVVQVTLPTVLDPHVNQVKLLLTLVNQNVIL